MSNKYVLSCINGFPPSLAVIDYGSWLAKTMKRDLKLFHAIDNQYHENTMDLSGSIGLGTREEMLKEIVSIEHEQNKLLIKKSQLVLESGKEHAQRSGLKDVMTISRKGRVLDNILDIKDDLAVAIIGKYGKRHQGMSSSGTSVGHKVEGLVKKINLPVMIVSDEFKQPTSILLSYDGSNGSIKVLNFLCHELKNSNLGVDLVLFGEENDERRKILADATAKLESANFTVTNKILPGEPEDALPDYMSNCTASILAMGAFGHGLLHELFVGSLTSKMIQQSNLPVLLVR